MGKVRSLKGIARKTASFATLRCYRVRSGEIVSSFAIHAARNWRSVCICASSCSYVWSERLHAVEFAREFVCESVEITVNSRLSCGVSFGQAGLIAQLLQE